MDGDDEPIAVTMTDGKPDAWYVDLTGKWGHTEGSDIYRAWALSLHSRLAAMTRERDDERLISVGHEARADRAEAALADVSDRIAALQMALAGGRVP